MIGKSTMHMSGRVDARPRTCKHYHFPKSCIEINEKLTVESNSHFFFNYLHLTRSTPHLRPPINLESLSIHMHRAYHAKEVLAIMEVIPLLTLPKLTTLVLSDVQGPFDSSIYLTSNTETERISPLKVLEIKHSCLSAEGLNLILSGKFDYWERDEGRADDALGIVALERFECRISDNDGGYSSGHTDSLSQILQTVSGFAFRLHFSSW